MPYLGEISAIITSVSFTLTSTFFTIAGRKVGSQIVNRARLVIGIGLILCAHWILEGVLFPTQVQNSRLLWLGLSGLIGLSLGDAFLFQAFIWIGPRLSTLLMSMAPIIASGFAWIILGEKLTWVQGLGILTTVLGIIWVILSKSNQTTTIYIEDKFWLGILFGLGGAVGQALGLVLSKKGLEGGFPPISGNLIRILFAATATWIITVINGQFFPTIRTLNANQRALGIIAIGTIFGPLIGVSFSLLAVQNTEVGVASTLMAFPPLFILPIAHLIFKEKISTHIIFGTILAVLGSAILFLF